MDTPPPPADAAAPLAFEDALAELEKIVRQLETGEVSLEESVALYERGQMLRAQCEARLNAAQARIEQIVPGGDGAALTTTGFPAGQ